VTNITNTEEQLEVITNGGPLMSTQKCEIPHLGECWYNPHSITNIIALSDMTKKFRVTMDSSKEKALLVHFPNKVVKFKQMKGGLYAMNPKDPENFGSISSQSHLIQTLEQNLECLSPHQRARAHKARALYDALGTPTVEDLKAMIRMNLIRNNKVTTKDVNLAVKAFGPDVGNIKGKARRRRPTPVSNNIIEIPDELLEVQRDVVMSMDGMTVPSSLIVLTAISHEIFYRTAQYVQTNTAAIYEKALDEVLRTYKRAQFQVTEIHCDNEFHKLMDPFAAKQDPIIKVNYATANKHVPRAERNNRTIQERVRAAYHCLPYDDLPRTMVKYLVMESAKKLNYFPNKNGVSKYYSPRMILHQENIDYECHCEYRFGEYVLAHDEPKRTNTNAPRALDCIYLHVLDSIQEGHELLHLPTNSVITRRKLTKMVLTPSIIRMVHRLAELDEMPKGLKIANRGDIILFDSAWIAGVDYDEFDDDDHQPNENDEDDHQRIENEVEDDSNGHEEEDSYKRIEEYDGMDENDLAEIMYEPHGFHVPDETNRNEETVVDQTNDEEFDEDDDDDDEDYDDSDDEDVSLVANDEEEEVSPTLRRTDRVRTPNPRYQHLHANKSQIEDYNQDTAQVTAYVMTHYNYTMVGMNDIETFSFLQTYSLNQDLERFGERGRKVAHKEVQQLHNCVVFEPIHIEEMTVL
jgi:hypothetical protein